MHCVKFNRLLSRCRVFAVAAAALVCVASGRAQTDVYPGTTAVLPIADSAENCFEDASVTSGLQPKTDCVADANSSSQSIQVLAASGVSSDPDNFFGQTVLSVGKLINTIRIPLPAGGAYSPALPVQIATEVAWSGGIVVAGIDSTFGQIVATLQMRDITGATAENPGPVVASNTFLFERVDADFEIIIPENPIDFAQFLNLIEIVDISNSTGADLTAFLVRGRTYAIELEARCDVQVPILGYGVCMFSPDALSTLGVPGNILYPSMDNDGFSAADITVTVGSDNVQNLFGS